MKRALISALVPLFLIACGGGGADVATIDQLPKMTNPVITGTSASSVKVDAATTGLAYWGTTGISFPNGSSRAMCETFNITREMLDRAAQGDKVLCYVQNTIVTDANKAALGSVDPYDGAYHIVALAGMTDQNGQTQSGKMKLKIVKSGSSITSFEMFMCMDGASQTEYMNQTISGNDITIVSKNIQGDTSGNWRGSLNVTGKLDAGQFTQKQITGVSRWLGSGNDNSSKVVLDQYKDAIVASAYQKGSYTGGGNTNTYSTQAYAKYELLNGSKTDLHTWAVGDGSVKVQMSNVMNSGTPYEPLADVASWLGDTRANTTATSGMFYSFVNAGTLPTADPSVEADAIAFSAAETWDCSDTAEAILTVDQVALDAACDQYGFRPNNSDSWIDCYNATGN
jgi:hypothetical protein